jgi:XTP/dITP diphosphohydrolase
LLEEMEGIPLAERNARFRCVMALATPSQMLGTASGVCQGRIALAPAGDGGFGYDPVFLIPGKGKTMAQLPAEEKHRISHRGRAFAAVTPLIRQALS